LGVVNKDNKVGEEERNCAAQVTLFLAIIFAGNNMHGTK
jgi:hypothetical protein